jgi:hypothetical protein
MSKIWRHMEEWIHRSTNFFLSALVHAPPVISHQERAPGALWIGSWVDSRATLDDMEKRKFLSLPGLELRCPCRPGRSQSLYRLRYPSSLHIWCCQNMAGRIIIFLHKLYSYKWHLFWWPVLSCPFRREPPDTLHRPNTINKYNINNSVSKTNNLT